MNEEKYYNKIMTNDKMYIEEAENIIDEMYQDKHKIIEENNKIDLNKLNDVKFTNLEFASVRMLREVKRLTRIVKNLKQENDALKLDNYKLDKDSQLNFEQCMNSIPKQVIEEKREKLIEKRKKYYGKYYPKDLTKAQFIKSMKLLGAIRFCEEVLGVD